MIRISHKNRFLAGFSNFVPITEVWFFGKNRFAYNLGKRVICARHDEMSVLNAFVSCCFHRTSLLLLYFLDSVEFPRHVLQGRVLVIISFTPLSAWQTVGHVSTRGHAIHRRRRHGVVTISFCNLGKLKN